MTDTPEILLARVANFLAKGLSADLDTDRAAEVTILACRLLTEETEDSEDEDAVNQAVARAYGNAVRGVEEILKR